MEPTELHTARLLLRSFKLSDADQVRTYCDDPVWARFMPTPYPYSQQDAIDFVTRVTTASWDVRPHFAIVLNQVVVGAISLRIDPPDRVGELGYTLKRDLWGHGYAFEAVTATLHWFQ
jgi:[ribosomal protein S5]-alanine N-acetyltransferase